jgi:hypothetical protein
LCAPILRQFAANLMKRQVARPLLQICAADNDSPATILLPALKNLPFCDKISSRPNEAISHTQLEEGSSSP